eukprot:TRINITY_DN11300_c0_g1_i1.p1 TRINITY_DN11300_c0_g1~~TRINITY_DN11300_c0_g1_i1.p1  ORF type:complete len:290 (+),score=48.08 TRINITY_DN11300_c0_g1_i1:120-989(+)
MYHQPIAASGYSLTTTAAPYAAATPGASPYGGIVKQFATAQAPSIQAPSIQAQMGGAIRAVPMGSSTVAATTATQQPAGPSSIAAATKAAASLTPQPQPLAAPAYASVAGHPSLRPAPQQFVQPKATGPSPAATVSREQVLEQRVRELESQLREKDETIKDLQAALNDGGKMLGNQGKKVRSPGRSGSGFRKVADSKPRVKYTAVDQEDPIDIRLEEFYNSTGSAVPFKRINRGFYRFGDSIVELDIINHKLMACTEDGWNRGKFGPIEKFLMYYENIEREKAGIMTDA